MENQRVKPTVTKLLINNQFVDSQGGQTFPCVNPATEEKICDIVRANTADCDLAIKAAREAFDNGPWRKMSAYERGRLMYKLADAMEANAHELADLESQDNGKPYNVAKNVDIALAIKVFRYYAGWCDKIQGTTIPIGSNHFCYTREEPVGVCAQIIPWNFPLLMLSWKWGPVLATGCVSILKSSEKTPLTALRIG